MARYKITDPNTGRTAVVSGDTPPTEADIDQIFADQPQENQPQQLSKQGAITGPLEQSGLYNIPFLGGLLGRGIAEPVAKGLEVGAEGVVSPLLDLLQKGKITNEKRFMDPETYQKIQQARTPQEAGNVVGPIGLQAGLATVGGYTLPSAIKNAPKIIPSAKSLMGYLTKSGLAKKIAGAGQKATAKGATDKFHDVATEIRQAVRQKFLPTKAVKKAESEIISNLAPSNLSDVVTPTDLIQGRQAITQTYGGGPQGFQKLLMQSTPEQKVGNVARSVLSKRAKDITPGLKPLDFLYSRVYSNPYIGDVPQIALKTAGILGLKQVAPWMFNSIFRGGSK